MKEIYQKYLSYQKKPNEHPKYIMEWNFFWLSDVYKLHGEADLMKLDFNPKWIEYWKQRIVELQDEDLLEIRIKLRKRMHLPVHPDDEKRWKQIFMLSKIKPKGAHSTVKLFDPSKESHVVIPQSSVKPIVDLNELLTDLYNKKEQSNDPKRSKTSDDELNIKRSHQLKENTAESQPNQENHEIAADQHQVVTSSDNNINDPSSSNDSPASNSSLKLMKSLSNNDVVLLFNNFDNLSSSLQEDLVLFMEKLERFDPKRYNFLIECQITQDSQDSQVSIVSGEKLDVSEPEIEATIHKDASPAGSMDNPEIAVVVLSKTEIWPLARPVAPEIEKKSESVAIACLESSSSLNTQPIILDCETINNSPIEDEDEDEDDYPLEDSEMLHNAQKNAKIIFIDSDDEIETIDLT